MLVQSQASTQLSLHRPHHHQQHLAKSPFAHQCPSYAPATINSAQLSLYGPHCHQQYSVKSPLMHQHSFYIPTTFNSAQLGLLLYHCPPRSSTNPFLCIWPLPSMVLSWSSHLPTPSTAISILGPTHSTTINSIQLSLSSTSTLHSCQYYSHHHQQYSD